MQHPVWFGKIGDADKSKKPGANGLICNTDYKPTGSSGEVVVLIYIPRPDWITQGDNLKPYGVLTNDGRDMNNNDILVKRGILNACQSAGWHEKGNRWHYPIFDYAGNTIGERSKAIDRDTRFKYLWHPAKPEHELSDWYILPGTIDAIKHADGVVYLANGEASCLAHHSAKLYNTIATTLSEVGIPKNLRPILDHATRVILLADNDDAGVKSAANWRDALAGTGIDFEALSWGDDKKAGYDSNDAWIACGFKPETFRLILDNLQPLALPAPEPKKQYTQLDSTNNDGIVRAIENALAIEGVFSGKVYQREWKQMRCVHHDDKQPSAGFNINSGVINCQVCGSHSPYETASVLGVDLSPFRKQVHSATQKVTKSQLSTKPERPEPITLPDAPEDTRTYTQVIDDELMALDMAYESGQRVSWYPSDDLPISWISALLNLASARSSMPAVVVKMHYALRHGTLKPYFTIADVVRATGYSTRLITKTLETLETMTFIHFLRTVSIDTLPPLESDKKGRPPQLWVINHDSEGIRDCLYNMLENKSLEKTTLRAIVNISRASTLQSQLNLTDDDYIALGNRSKLALSEETNADADRAYMREMFGNGHEWKGWKVALNNDYAIPLDVNTFDNSKDLRGQVALWWIAHVRDTNSREDWQRILGCSDATIDSVFVSVDIKTIQQNEQIEVPAPSTVKAMETLYIGTQRKYRGKIWKISYKVEGEKGWQVSSEYTYKKTFVQNLGKIEKVFMILTTPSKQVLMDADEIEALKAREEMDTEQQPDNIIEPDFTPDTTPEQAETQEDKPKRIVVPRNEHVYTTFTHTWLFRQMQMLVYSFTDYRLMNDGTVQDIDGNRVQHRVSLSDLVTWFNGVASDSQLRTVASFFGDDHDDESEMKELQRIERIHFFETNYQERVVPSLVAMATITKLAEYGQAGALSVQVVAKPEQKSVYIPSRWDDAAWNKKDKFTGSRFAREAS